MHSLFMFLFGMSHVRNASDETKVKRKGSNEIMKRNSDIFVFLYSAEMLIECNIKSPHTYAHSENASNTLLNNLKCNYFT